MLLETSRLLLRPLTLDDVASVNLFESDPLVTRWLSCEPQSMQDSEAWVSFSVRSQSDSPRHNWELAVIERNGDGAVIGKVGLRQELPDPRDAKLWYVFRRESWGKGFAAEALRPLVDFGFRELGLHRVWVDIDPENVGSRRVAEKLGMRQEAHFVENVFLKGEWRDTVILAVLDREWRG